MATETRKTDVGQEVRAEMGRQRVTMVELSRRTNIARATLSYQVNSNRLSVSNLQLIADALGVTVAALVGEVAA